MDMLTQAVRTKLPFVHITTDDLIHIGEVLSFISGVEAKYLSASTFTNDMTSLPDGEVFYTSCDVPSPKLYMICKNEGKCLVFVNTKTSVMFFNGGVMFPPKDLMRAYLLSLGCAEADAEALLPAYGGLTLKDMYEVTQLTLHRAGNITTREINSTRQGYITKLKGITQIDTKYSFYQCPSLLQHWMDKNLPFFSQDISPQLTPRGLLLDGPPGTGKTMGAKHIACTLGVPLYHLDIGAIKGKYVGDSEGNLHAALAQVDQVEPCVVLIDEVEKIFGEQHDSGVTSSLLGTLLWWLQEHKTKVFTVMTTNKKEVIPPELYREGRIDETMMFSGIEGLNNALVFAEQVFDALMKDNDWNLPALDKAAVEKSLKVLFSDQSAVAQVKVTQLIHSIAKEMLLEVL
jgi:hypothetical protein